MPRNTEPGTALALPEDIRRELLEAQKESIALPQRLPTVGVMAAGVGLFEFQDTNETAATFRGVILASHPRNILWDKKFGQEPRTEEEKFPACASPDGKYGHPRPGFRHEALGGRAAQGDESIDCHTCPYNKFGSGNKLISDKNPKGKAVTNQRSVYIAIEGRMSPVDLTLPPTSMAALDEYMTMLLNRQLPAPAVVTEFGQVRKEKGGMKWGVVTLKLVRELNAEEFAAIMQMRRDYLQVITPASAPSVQMPVGESTGLPGVPIEGSEEDDMPF